MSEPANEPRYTDQPEPPGTSAVIDDVDVAIASDQWPTADLTDLDQGEQGDQS